MSSSFAEKSRLTNDLLVGAIFPNTDVNEVKHSLCSSETPDKVFKVLDCCNCTRSHQHIPKASDVGVNSTDDTGGEGDIFGFVLNPVAHGGVKLGCCAATSSSSITNVLVAELRTLVTRCPGGEGGSYDHTVAVNEHHDERVLRLQQSVRCLHSTCVD
jgi:hypothetical protein